MPNSHASTNDRGEFSFSAVPPGDYLLGINVSQEPSSGAAFRPTYFPGTTDRLQATPVTVGLGTEHTDIEWVVSSRLRDGAIEVSFDTHGQPQKNMGVCVTMFDAKNQNKGGAGYERRSDMPVVVQIVEGVRYRLIAYAETPMGFAESEVLDLIGSPGRQRVTLPVASTTTTATGAHCSSANSLKPFAP